MKNNSHNKKSSKANQSSMKKKVPGKAAESFPVAAIGASAGGLDAIERLLKSLPVNLGIAYVIIQHLAPNHESILPELLAKKTEMPVRQVGNNMTLKPDQVYVIPPNTYMTIENNKLKLAPRTIAEGNYHTIDHFLTTLAGVFKEKAIAIILSGTATDGTLGVKAVKAEGGITFAQDDTAKYQGMPRSAMDTGAVDFVLSPEKIAGELVKIIKHPLGLVSSEKLQPDNDDAIRRILAILYTNRGTDFSCYKKSTIHRRIIRRMVLNRLKSLRDYVQLLREDVPEVNLLYNDLLINVTRFFREPSIYEMLKKKVFPTLVKKRSPSDPVRIWVPGCATGEEAYSMVICLSEFLDKQGVNIPYQIFATDLDETAIERARKGLYLKSALQDMSPQRLNRFFVKANGNYQIIKPIRDACVFAPHNLLKDPPFSHLDVISCHNVLIYLDNEPKRKILQMFHYALKPTGYLLLGKSETAGNEDNLFEQVDKENKIYSKKSVSHGMRFNFFVNTPYPDNVLAEGPPPSIKESNMDLEKEVDKILLSSYIPAGVLVNKDLDILGFRGAVSRYLEPAAGKASLHLMKMVRDELVFELRTLMNKVKKEGVTVRKERVHFESARKTDTITIEIVPIGSPSKEIDYLIIFKEEPSVIHKEDSASSKKEKAGSRDRRISLLEQQLKEAREYIKSMSEEYESTREELQSSNEELLSSNEELQSMNEELETSQEELQSTNEELTTINDELHHRNLELKEATDYSDAIIRTIREPLIVLDSDLRVNTANEAYYSMFGTSRDKVEGQLFYEINDSQWDSADLRKLIQQIYAENKNINDFKIEKKFSSIGRRILLLNASPMNMEGKRSKILIAIEDITEREEIEQQKDNFISVASHELKTPVTSIKVYTQMLQQLFASRRDKESEKLMNRMKTQVDKLIQLIGNLLDLTKIANGALQYEEEEFDLNELITTVADDMKAYSQNHQLILELKPATTITGDAHRIEQVLVNLIVNAIKFSPDANKVIIHSRAISPAGHPKAKHIEVCVQDFGAGISEDMQRNIFERFFQVNSSRSSVAGIGLGLYISSEIIKRHGGKIWVESKKGKGSAFYFTLPVLGKKANEK
jgi:two-component system CheB/CheR fusion protein